jgi:hypothetical protein
MLRRLSPGLLVFFAVMLLTACQTAQAAGTSPEPAVMPTPAALGSINGWVGHAPCPAGGQLAGPETEITACTQVDDHAYANGIRAKLSAGPCAVIGPAVAETLVTDLEYSFTRLKAGTYCVSIDPLVEPSLSKLQNGSWATRLGGTIYTTVNLRPGEDKFGVNFGWSYADRPANTAPSSAIATR